MSLVLTEVTDGVGTLTLNYSLKRNTLSEPLVREISEAFASFESQGVRSLIVTNRTLDRGRSA